MKEPEQYPWYEIHSVEKIDSPTLVIYLHRVKENIKTAIEMVGDANRLRPHVKTHKSADVTRLMLEAGITKFKCATIAEADMLGAAGAPDVLLAYQPIGPKVDRFVALVKQYPSTRYSCLVDNLDAAHFISRKANEINVEIPVFIDLNVGMNRTGITPNERALILYEQVAKMKGIKPVGLHAYDGHIGDSYLDLRTQRSDEAFLSVTAIKEKLYEKGYKNSLIVAGGSPTFPIHARRTNIECSPGTFVYWDAGYGESYPEQTFKPAALVITRIISLLENGRVCTDLGHKSIAAENPLHRRVRFLNAPHLEAVSQSEEHLVLKNLENHPFAVGDVLYGMPLHICPTCALYERAVVVENGDVIGEWKIAARDRKITV